VPASRNLGGCGQATGQKTTVLTLPNFTTLAAFSDAWRKNLPNEACTPQAANSELDFKLENHGSVFLLRPLSSAAKEWMQLNLPVDSPETQFWGDAIVIEWRYVDAIVDGIIGDGLVLR
jgi:hypothetical protein